MNYYEVAVAAPLPKTFTYSSDHPVERGQLVQVPFGKRIVSGVVLGPGTPPEDLASIKSIETLSDEFAPIDASRLRWLLWISDYYLYPPGQTLQLSFPPLKKKGKARKPPIELGEAISERPTLTDEQTQASLAIQNSIGFQAHLLYGITGSGKTEVYLDVLEKKIQRGMTGLVLVPEISLTPQLIRRFSERFGDQIAVIHSQLTEREKTNQWWSLLDQSKRILIGARSAIFCPIPNLGVIIVDEEHEGSFKQDEKLKYHARDCAIKLAQELAIPICLGSATPSLESWNNAQEGKYQLHRLTKRVTSQSLASVQVVDLRDEDKSDSLPGWLSQSLYQKILSHLNEKKQVALFLNRRGLSQFVMCRDCGFTYLCPNCDISLSLHAKTHLTCHYCGFHEDLGTYCKVCQQGEPKPIGHGTEKIEKDIQDLFPQARTIRMDRDEINNRLSLEDAVRKIEDHEVDVIVGTQMIAKGLDFKQLSLVGIVLADIGFNIPDFRTSERNFQLLTQVSGRSGRHGAGEVVIQTYNPTYPSLVFAKEQDYESFATSELEQRKELLYPPFGKLLSLRIQSINYSKLKDYIRDLERSLQTIPLDSGFQVLGPAIMPIFKVKNTYRYSMLVKSQNPKILRNFYSQLTSKIPPPSGIRLIPDMDPLNTF